MILNKLEIIGNYKQAKEVLNFVKGAPDEDGNPVYIDFNKIIKMPEELCIEFNHEATIEWSLQSGVQISQYIEISKEEAIMLLNKLSQNEKKRSKILAKIYQNNFLKYGEPNWYFWRISNWGTRWNATYQTMQYSNIIMFYTTWNDASFLIMQLSNTFPDIEFIYSSENIDGSPMNTKIVFYGGDIMEMGNALFE